MFKIYTRYQTKTAQKPYPLGRHIPIYLIYGSTPPGSPRSAATPRSGMRKGLLKVPSTLSLRNLKCIFSFFISTVRPTVHTKRHENWAFDNADRWLFRFQILANFLQRSVEEEHLIGYQSENSVFKLIRRIVDGASDWGVDVTWAGVLFMIYESSYPNRPKKTHELCKPVNDFQRHYKMRYPAKQVVFI